MFQTKVVKIKKHISLKIAPLRDNVEKNFGTRQSTLINMEHAYFMLDN